MSVRISRKTKKKVKTGKLVISSEIKPKPEPSKEWIELFEKIYGQKFVIGISTLIDEFTRGGLENGEIILGYQKIFLGK